jgi:O-antigen ligase
VIQLILVAFLIRERRDLKHLAVFTMILGAVSGYAAISQHFSPTSALYAAGSVEDIRDWSGRAIGLSASPVILAADMPFVLMPILGVLAVGAIRFDRPRLQLAAMAGFVFLGCYFTYSRSAMPAIGVGLIMIALLLRGSRRKVIIGGLLFLALLFPQMENTGLIGSRFYRDASDDKSAASHEAAWQVGLALALDHPLFGIGHDRYGVYAPQYVDVVDEELVAVGGTATLEQGLAYPHNDFLNIWFSWGIMALIAHVLLYVGALVNCIVAARSNDLLIRGMAVGTAGGLIAYGANSALHNYLDSTGYLWIYAGLSVALVRLAALSQPPGIGTITRAMPRRGF